MEHPDGPPVNLPGMKVRELLARWPTTAQLFIAYRLACVGCQFAGFHTAQQALDLYGIDDRPFLDELRRMVQRHGDAEPNPSGEGGT